MFGQYIPVTDGTYSKHVRTYVFEYIVGLRACELLAGDEGNEGL